MIAVIKSFWSSSISVRYRASDMKIHLSRSESVLEHQKRAFKKCDERLDRFYFDHERIYDENDFERRFRIPRNIFNRILHGICGRGIFRQRFDATKSMGSH